MAITLASHGGGFVNSGNPSPSITIPVTCSAGDVIYLLSSSSTNTLAGETFSTVISGFPLLRCVAASAHSGSSLVVSAGSFTPLSAIMQAWTGVDNTKNTFGSIGSNMGSTVAGASVTTAAANSLVALFVDCPNSSVTITAGSGYTISDVDGPSNWTYGAEYANSTTATSGTVVAPSANLSSSVIWSALAISLAPSSGGGGSSARRRSSACLILP